MVLRTKSGRALNYNRSFGHDLAVETFKANKFQKIFGVFPRSVDLRPQDSPIFDQGREGSCTANAACGLADFLEIKKGLGASPWDNPQEYIKNQFEPASRAFVYWVERAFDGDPTQDNGSFMHTAAAVFNQKGAPSETDYPYGPSTLYGKPSSELFGKAWHHKVGSIQKIQDGDMLSVYACLAQGYPVMFGFPVYPSYEQLNSYNYFYARPSFFERPLGGHANVWVGYDERGNLLGRNSWGTKWGNQGYYLMEQLFAVHYCTDLWTFR